MDESFQLRAKQLLNGRRQPAPLDHDVLRAALAVQQAASPAACAQARAVGGGQRGESDPLTEILLAGSGWEEAASAQRGCFNRAESIRLRNIR